MNKRERNEQDYDDWEDLSDGGRRYWYDVPGKQRGFARYVKTVDANENTLSFVQEVYDDKGHLVATHQKYPQDTGHQDILS